MINKVHCAAKDKMVSVRFDCIRTNALEDSQKRFRLGRADCLNWSPDCKCCKLDETLQELLSMY
jgi:hypothetical protein